MNATFAPRFRLGNYELLVELASGGMATVGIALQHGAAGFERLVVVKRVHRHLLKNKEFSNMFRDEARLSSSIRHANVVPVIDVIENEGELCLVMEYFESLALSSMLDAAVETQKPIPPSVTSRILSDMLAGLHAAHEAVDIRRHKLGIVHRDISPQNIIVDVGGVSRVIDFGVAKAKSRLTETRSGYVKGKVGYMSPEQIEALPIDRRTDVFAAGVVLHETLTGNRLFHGQDEFEIMRRVLRGEIPRPSTLATGLSQAADQLVEKALARSASDRFQTALEFQSALERTIPPAPAAEVAACLVDYCGVELEERHQKLLSMLGNELGKLSPRSTPRNNTTMLRDEAGASGAMATLFDPAPPAMMAHPTIRDLPIVSVPEGPDPGLATLRSEGSGQTKHGEGAASTHAGSTIVGATSDADAASSRDVAGLPPRMAAPKLIALSALVSAIVAGIAFAALRGPAEPASSTAPIGCTSSTPSSPPSPPPSVSPVAPSSVDASVAPDPAVPSRPARPKPGGAGKGKPAETLQPNPY